MLELLKGVLSYDQALDMSAERIVLSDVIFKEDFGPWRRGEHVSLIAIQDGLMEQLGDYVEGVINSVPLVLKFLKEDS